MKQGQVVMKMRDACSVPECGAWLEANTPYMQTVLFWTAEAAHKPWLRLKGGGASRAAGPATQGVGPLMDTSWGPWTHLVLCSGQAAGSTGLRSPF